uniref:CKLF like MARVEL transmembrane domain containing 7 n=1 Tax=Saimiri boliviensis boliviensis TaxID=39432 RepID=A0A2K6TFP5_SAIBB
ELTLLGGRNQISDVSVFIWQVTLLIAFICVRSSLWTDYSAYSYFEVVTICDLIMILAFYLVHLFRFYRVLTCISWPLSELLHYLIGTLLLLIASIVAASKSYSQSGLVAGAIFGFMATFLCMASMWLSYKVSCVTQSTGEFWSSVHRGS